MLPTRELDYELPERAIATAPVEPRDSARLLVLPLRPEAPIRHACVRDLPDLLRPGDLLVYNTSRVLQAWLRGHRVGTGGRFHGLYLAPARAHEPAPPGTLLWEVLLRARHLHPGVVLLVETGPPDRPTPSGAQLRLLERSSNDEGGWIVRVEPSSGTPLELHAPNLLERIGATPIPPYIRRARRMLNQPEDLETDRARYQTIYARASAELAGEHGSVAAPTAGLHFTPNLLERLRERGIVRADVVLHVGAGTFKPIETQHVEEHPIHSEVCSLSPTAIEKITKTRAQGGRVICVGTTTVRAVETYAQRAAQGADIRPWESTQMLITPGHQWLWTDGLLTNFHLPRSTLLALVASRLEGPNPVQRLLEAYRQALHAGYRFFSYGDAMLLLPDSRP